STVEFPTTSDLIPDVAVLQLEPTPPPVGTERPDLETWNTASAREIAPGVLQADIRTKWVRFLDEDGTFKPIDTALATTSDGWCMDKAPFKACFPLRSTGTALFHNNNRFDLGSKSVIGDAPMDETITALGVADVAGALEHGDLGWGETEYVIYRGAYPDLN